MEESVNHVLIPQGMFVSEAAGGDQLYLQVSVGTAGEPSSLWSLRVLSLVQLPLPCLLESPQHQQAGDQGQHEGPHDVRDGPTLDQRRLCEPIP